MARLEGESQPRRTTWKTRAHAKVQAEFTRTTGPWDQERQAHCSRVFLWLTWTSEEYTFLLLLGCFLSSCKPGDMDRLNTEMLTWLADFQVECYSLGISFISIRRYDLKTHSGYHGKIPSSGIDKTWCNGPWWRTAFVGSTLGFTHDISWNLQRWPSCLLLLRLADRILTFPG